MKVDKAIRTAIAVVVVAVFVVATAALLFITESALNVWDRLKAGPPVIFYAYVAVMLLLLAAAIALIWRLVVKRSPKAPPPAAKLKPDEIKARLVEAEGVGVDVSAAQAELKDLAARQDSGAIDLCFFGEVSGGKSSLIKALVPDASVDIDVIGGSTADVGYYRWRNDAGDAIRLVDVPGTGGQADGLTELARDEAVRSHLVLFVCDGDLTRSEMDAVRELLQFDKPMVVVLNKRDRYSADEQALLMQQLLQRIETAGGAFERDHVVAVSAGGAADVVVTDTDGTESTTRRQRNADIGALVVAINRLLGDDTLDIDARRERAVFEIAGEKLLQAEAAYRQQRSEQVIRAATRKAVVGALAAISPGTDILIQGYIGTAMTQELCKLYGAAPRDLDVEEFLNLSQSRVGRALPLSLAVAGNGLKAFPGLGTVAGGLVHAVAYGLIFDALGRSLVSTLSRHGRLDPETAATAFEENIGEHLEAGVRRIAKMALEETPD